MKPTLTNRKSIEIVGLELLDFRDTDGFTSIISYCGRPFVVIKDGTDFIPYWMSTGRGGKRNVKCGKWYPVVGMSPKWINKYDDDSLNSYYGSERLAKYAKILDEKLRCLNSKGNPNRRFGFKIPVLKAEFLEHFLELLNTCSPKPLMFSYSGDVRVTADLFLRTIGERPYFGVAVENKI